MKADGRTAPQVAAGFPQTMHSALTPQGQIEQATNFAAGLKQPRHGWRRAVAIIGFVVVALGAVAVIVAGMLDAARH
jgi:hypothetical protein